MPHKIEINLSYCIYCGTVQVQGKGVTITECLVCKTVRTFASIEIDPNTQQFVTYSK